jgi:peptidoglycan-associated lipoprotein
MIKNGVTVLVALASSMIACSHEPSKANTVATPARVAVHPHNTTAHSVAQTCSVDLDCGTKQLCIRSQCVDITPGLAECSSVRVHFDFNDAQLKPSETDTLQRMARCLRADSKLHVTIEGNADERGTEEWNLALGDKRATAVAEYLQRLGASSDQLRTVTYGKEHPLCAQHNEACWAQNRRAAVKPKEAR